MNALVRINRLPAFVVKRRGIQTSVKAASATTPTPSEPKTPAWAQNFDPNNYDIPLRVPTMDDCMEPYGSWKLAYERERRAGNIHLAKGIVMFATTLAIFYYSGTTDSLFMPNLDNIMEDTQPFNFDTEGRMSVHKDED